MKRMTFRLLGLAILLPMFVASSAQAQGKLRGMARLGLEAGGDKVIEFQYEDGSTPDVTAGGGLLLSGGAALQLAPILDAQVNVGFKYRTIPAATNQDATWMRFPVEALLFFRAPNGVRVGGGTTVHLANTLKASGGVLNSKMDFKNKPGFLLQAEYVARSVSFDVRYTIMDYEVERGGSGTISANSIGVGVSYLFGR